MAKRLLSTQRIVNLAADPATGTAGEIYYNTVSNSFKYYDGSAWIAFSSGGGSGVPIGGTGGQILAKIDETNYNTHWIDNIANYTSQVKHNVKAAEAINKGQAVYVSSADGANKIVSKASNSSEVTSSKTLGLLEQNLSTNATGFVVTEGLISGLNTSSATAGDPVWLGTNGNLLYGTANKPAPPIHTVFIGIVTRVQQNNGQIFVKVQNGYELDELHNVLINGIADNHIISYDNATSLWKNQALVDAIKEVDGASSGIDSDLLDGQHGSYYAPTNSPSLTGTPLAPTASIGTSTTQIATTAFVQGEGFGKIYYQASAPSTPSVGAVWVESDEEVDFFSPSVIKRWTKILTSTQSLFSGTSNGVLLAYTPGYEHVYLNGLLLVRSEDYTATDGAAINLTAPASIGDVFEVISALPFSVANVYDKSETDNLLILKAPLASPTLTGVPAAPTATAGTNTTQIATTAFVRTEVANLIASSPAALDTLDELAAALGDDANFATTVNTALSNRVLTTGGSTVTVSSGTTVPLTIQNNGTGDSFVVNDVASDTSPFVIDASGNVGIGTSTPAATVEINGSANFGSSNGIVGGAFSVNCRTNANWNFSGLNVIRNAANTTTPRLISMPLDADNLAETTIGTYNAIWGEYSGNPTTNSTSSGLSGQMIFGAHSGFKFITNGTERLRVASSGRVTLPAGGILEAPVSTNAQTGTSYTLVLADAGKLVELNNASAITLTVPTEASVNFPVGTTIDLLQTGAGQVTVGGAGVTINATPGLKISAQWGSATLIKRATNTWVLVGSLSA